MESELGRELLNLNKELAVQVHAQSLILSALLRVLDPSKLKEVSDLLQAHAAASESHGLAGDSGRLAVQLASLSTDDDDSSGLCTLLRVLPGGKKG